MATRGAFAQAKVHAGVKEEIVFAAAGFVSEVLGQLAEMVLRRNYGEDDECPCISLESQEEEDLKDKAEMIKTLAEAGAGAVIGLEWLGKTFGIPMPGKGERTLAEMAGGADPEGSRGGAETRREGKDETGKPKSEEDEEDLQAGDRAGHPFRGNQWTKGVHVVMDDKGWTGTPKEMRKRAAEIYKTLGTVEHPVLGTISFTGVGKDKTLHGKRSPHEFEAVAALPELVKKAKLRGEMEEDRQGRPHIKGYYKLDAGLRIGPATYSVEITVRRVEASRAYEVTQFYLHRLEPVHKNKNAASPYSATPRSGGPDSILGCTLDHTTADVNGFLSIEDDAEFARALLGADEIEEASHS